MVFCHWQFGYLSFPKTYHFIHIFLLDLTGLIFQHLLTVLNIRTKNKTQYEIRLRTLQNIKKKKIYARDSFRVTWWSNDWYMESQNMTQKWLPSYVCLDDKSFQKVGDMSFWFCFIHTRASQNQLGCNKKNLTRMTIIKKYTNSKW